MSISQLPPDQRAVLSLLLRQGRSYGEVAGMLAIEQSAVRDRAQAALAVLAPGLARALTPARREQIGDYLLGQQTAQERFDTLVELERSADSRAWAEAISTELAPLADQSLAQLPEAGSAGSRAGAAPAPSGSPTTAEDASGGRDGEGQEGGRRDGRGPARELRVSRRGGAALLAVLVAIVVVAVILIVDHGSSTGSSGTVSGETQTNGGASAGGSSTTATATTSAHKPKVDRQLNLVTPSGAQGEAVGIAEVVSEGSQYAFYLDAEKLPPTSGFRYFAWLYDSAGEAYDLGEAPKVTSKGRLGALGSLPADASKYRHLILTRETAKKPTTPGTIVLEGPFSLH